MDIVVFGAGSLGSLVGGLLAREHDVTLVGREDHVRAVRADGLRIEGVRGRIDRDGPERVNLRAIGDGTHLDTELVVVTVKAFDAAAAARTLATGTFEAVLSLQNGMGNEETLASRLDCPVLAGTASYGAILREPGVVERTGVGEIVLGPREGGRSSLADRVGEAFAGAGLETVVADDMPLRLWEKLAVNAGINAVTALTRIRNGAVLEADANELARSATRETARVARATGVTLSNRRALAAMEDVAAATAANESSMLQDVRAERRTEVDAINGYVVDRASARGLAVPTNRTLSMLLRAWERERGLR
ncbi:ketopantoate reductase family protein [Halosolutus gelatinilyticus]|uniref:ketopantoate reductase family protein n=1 Tax=Halosolutus gelatinilyticus TaxID=2931975 RepID=UPI001FF59222|nr:2-dehydropantoate 2-reductase [Halosolutus gelatinilyticus]